MSGSDVEDRGRSGPSSIFGTSGRRPSLVLLGINQTLASLYGAPARDVILAKRKGLVVGATEQMTWARNN